MTTLAVMRVYDGREAVGEIEDHGPGSTSCRRWREI
jgi:hypothetical protein